MTDQTNFQTRWAQMDDAKRQDFLDVLRETGKLSEVELAQFPDLPGKRDMMDCLCDCEESYDKSIENCKKNSTDYATCKAAAREALTNCCAKCGD